MPFRCPSTFAACPDATVYQNQDRALVQFAVLVEMVRSEAVQSETVRSELARNVLVLIDSVLNEGIRISDSPNVKDARNFPDAKVVQAVRFVEEAAHSVAVANFEVLQLAEEVHFAAELKHVAAHFAVAVVHTTETVSQRVSRALKARGVHGYVSASHLDPE